MKQDVTEFLIDSFVDYKGDKHYVVVCALSQSPIKTDGDFLMVAWSDGDTIDVSADICNDVYRTLSIGIAICCPNDKFDETVGKRIAQNRAEKAIPKLVSLEQGVINTTLVRAFLHQEMEFIKKNPERFIVGYEEAKFRYDKKVNLEKELKNLSNEEATVVQAALDGVDIIKCAKLAKQISDRSEKFN